MKKILNNFQNWIAEIYPSKAHVTVICKNTMMFEILQPVYLSSNHIYIYHTHYQHSFSFHASKIHQSASQYLRKCHEQTDSKALSQEKFKNLLK